MSYHYMSPDQPNNRYDTPQVYPDPVRVISVGPPVGSLLSNPKDEQWRGSSIEFCGGTHLSNTREAEAFVITEETAVAKGIRRISVKIYTTCDVQRYFFFAFVLSVYFSLSDPFYHFIISYWFLYNSQQSIFLSTIDFS